MPNNRKPPRKRLSYFDAQDRVINLNSLYRFSIFGFGRANFLARQSHRDLDEVAPEPDVELEDSELSDAERRQAIGRERLRRERRG